MNRVDGEPHQELSCLASSCRHQCPMTSMPQLLPPPHPTPPLPLLPCLSRSLASSYSFEILPPPPVSPFPDRPLLWVASIPHRCVLCRRGAGGGGASPMRVVRARSTRFLLPVERRRMSHAGAARAGDESNKCTREMGEWWRWGMSREIRES